MTTSSNVALRGKARDAAIRALDIAGSLRRARERIVQRSGIIVLTLHRIVPDAMRPVCRSPSGMVLRESLFIRLIEYLGERAVFISPEDLDHLQPDMPAGNPARPRILITFDDGWLDNAVVALPHLRRVKIRACFFVATALPGHPCPFWPERVLGLLACARRLGLISVLAAHLDHLQAEADHAPPSLMSTHGEEALLGWLKQFPASELFCWIESTSNALHHETLRVAASPIRNTLNKPLLDPMEKMMTWDTLRTLARDGHRMGSHTCTHAILPQLNKRSMAYELEASRCALQEQLPHQAADSLWVSYPNGSASPEVLEAARDAGYRYGFSNTPGVWHSNSEPFLIPRLNVWDGTLVDSQGAFSEKHLEYSLFWRTSRAQPDL